MSFHKVNNYTFQWTSEHMPKEQSDALKYEYDELGSQVVNKLQEIAQKNKTSSESAKGPPQCPFNDLYTLLRDHHTEDETLSRFWHETHTVPEWVDWEQIKRGQNFFYRYAPGNLMGFGLQAFMGENTVAPGVSEVLLRTGGFSTRTLLRRLLETFQLILQVTDSLESVQPGGEGHRTIIRVRLLHSSVRERIMKIERTRGDYFDMESLGVPISTVGSIHSITTFCCNHSWLQLPFMGIHPTEQETADYIALFRYVAHVIGTPTEHVETPSRAKATMESMLLNEYRLNDTAYIVSHNLIQCLTDLPPFNVSAGFIEAGSRVFNGHEFCDKIRLGRPGLYSYACFRGFCWLVRGLALLQHNIPAFDALVTGFFKRSLHEGVIHSKEGLAGGSKLEFKHVPQAGKLIGREDHGRLSPRASLFARPVEAFLFGVFLFGCLLLPVVFTFILWACSSMYGAVEHNQQVVMNWVHWSV